MTSPASWAPANSSLSQSSALFIGIIGGCYAIFGGLKAVAVSDTINGIGLIIGGLMIPFLGFAALSAATGGHGILDGVKYMIEADPAKMKRNQRMETHRSRRFRGR